MPEQTDYFISSPYAVPSAVQQPPPSALSRADAVPEVTAGGVVAAVALLLGAPVGLLWGHLAPGVDVVRTADGVELLGIETKGFIAADGWFLVMGTAVGVLCGLVAWRVGRQRGVGVAVGLAAGCLLAALAAAHVGQLVGLERFTDLQARAPAATQGQAVVRTTAPPCVQKRDDKSLECSVKAHGVLFGWPVAALLTMALATLWGDRPRSGHA